MKKHSLLVILTFIFTSYISVSASGPLIVQDGMTFTYGTRPLVYRYDQGDLGKLTNSEITKIIEDLFSTWESIPTSTVKFQMDDPAFLDADINKSNFDPILNSSFLLGYTPIIFDNDGSIVNSLLGVGSANSILGFSGQIIVDSGPLASEIAESQALFNGKFINKIKETSDPELSEDSLKSTILHEVGHSFGLDHTQINSEAISTGASKELTESVPLMFPIAVNDSFVLKQDDISSASLLYPNESELTNYGKIEGKVFREDGITPVLGANVIARNLNNPKKNAISCVSDFLANNTGSYTLFGLLPGSYKIEVESIDLLFTEGSGVGPYTRSVRDKSFINPVPHGFYTGPNLPISKDEEKALVVDLKAGQTISDLNINASIEVNLIPNTDLVNINEAELNNSIDTAQLIAPSVIISGEASKSDQDGIQLTPTSGNIVLISDLFKFILQEASIVNSYLTIEGDEQENDLDLFLLDDSGKKVIDDSATGNSNELINKLLQPGTYILGINPFSGSSSYKLRVTTLKGLPTPSLTLKGPDTFSLKQGIKNILELNAIGSNFTSETTCKLLYLRHSLVKVKPAKFTLSDIENQRTIKILISKSKAANLIANKSNEIIPISVSCTNGASDEFEILVISETENLILR